MYVIRSTHGFPLSSSLYRDLNPFEEPLTHMHTYTHTNPSFIIQENLINPPNNKSKTAQYKRKTRKGELNYIQIYIYKLYSEKITTQTNPPTFIRTYNTYGYT